MGFFDWGGDKPKDGPLAYIWIYAVSVVSLTLLSMGIFYLFIFKARFKGDSEKNARDSPV